MRISMLFISWLFATALLHSRTPGTGTGGELDTIYGEYLAGPDIQGLVSLDGRIRRLLEEPWRRSRKSIDRSIYKPAWAAIGIDVGHYSDSLEYSGRLLVEAHRKNPVSELRRFTLFSAVMGERPSHGLGEMPDVNVALRYLKEFPRGPFARDAAIILADFYSDLFKVISALQQNQPHDYKYDCFSKFIEGTDFGGQADRARRLSVAFYNQALADAPAGWAETTDLKHRQSVMQSGDLKLIDALGWHFCAD